MTEINVSWCSFTLFIISFTNLEVSIKSYSRCYIFTSIHFCLNENKVKKTWPNNPFFRTENFFLLEKLQKLDNLKKKFWPHPKCQSVISRLMKLCQPYQVILVGQKSSFSSNQVDMFCIRCFMLVHVKNKKEICHSTSQGWLRIWFWSSFIVC